MKKIQPFLLALVLLFIGYLAWKMIIQSTLPDAPSRKPSVPVATEKVGEHPVARQLSLIGNLKSENSVIIASEVGGKIKSVHVKAGDKVKEGTLLISLDTAKTHASLAEAKAFYDDEQRKLAEFSNLNQRGALTKTELDAQQTSVDIAKARLDAAQAIWNDHHIKAPFEGTIGLVDITRGQLISASEALLNLDDLSLMQLDINVPEQYLSQLSKDIKVTAHSKAWKNTPFAGVLTAVDSRVNNDSLNLRARIHIQNTQGLLRPGMMMEAILDFEPLVTMVIPVQAIEYSGTKRFVYKVGENNIAQRTEVKLGARLDNRVTVENGLSLGDSIVVEGLVSMRDGAKVKDLSVLNDRKIESEQALEQKDEAK